MIEQVTYSSNVLVFAAFMFFTVFLVAMFLCARDGLSHNESLLVAGLVSLVSITVSIPLASFLGQWVWAILVVAVIGNVAWKEGNKYE